MMKTGKKPVSPGILLAAVLLVIATGGYSPAKALACQQLSKSVLDTEKYTIIAPAGWERSVKTTQEGFEILIFTGPVADNISPNLNVIVQNLQGASFDQYIEQTIQALKTQSKVVLEGSGIAQGKGTTGRYLISTIKSGELELAIKTYIFEKNGLAYVITCLCPASQKDTYRAIFDNVVKTFAVK